MLAQLSDPHLRLDRPDTVRAFERAVAAVAALDPAPAAVLLSGDVADTGAPAEYAAAGTALAALPMPVHVIPGNHDDAPALAAAFGAIEVAVTAGPLRLVCADSTHPVRDDGVLGRDRIARLDALLAEDRATPTVLALHHPPILTGIRALDDLALQAPDRARLADLLRRHPQVARVVTGHDHRTATGAIAGVPVFLCPGTNRQLALDLTGAPELVLGDDPPGFAVHVLVDGAVVSHVQPLPRR